MIEIKNKAECTGCHACYSKCPQSCIDMVEDKEGFLYPNVDSEKCIQCGLCEKVCPILHRAESLKIKKVYDVSAVSIPANGDTEIAARNFASRSYEAEKQERLKRRIAILKMQASI